MKKWALPVIVVVSILVAAVLFILSQRRAFFADRQQADAIRLLNEERAKPFAAQDAARRAAQDAAPLRTGTPTAPAAAPAASSQTAQKSARAESARVAVDKMVNLGLIKRMDVKTGKFYIDGPLWVGFELDGKESIVKTISGYREAEYKGLPQVTLYESRSGKELANYGAFSGVTIK